MMTGRDRPAYPTFPASCWWPLRERFKRSLPPAITAEYLQAVLEVEPKTARNLLPMLRQMGLVDEHGAPRERANAWRVDAEYAQVCDAIRTELYPAALRHAVPDPTGEFDVAVRWFMKTSGVGTAAAKRMARFYALLSKADPAEIRERAERRSDAPLRRPTPREGGPHDASARYGGNRKSGSSRGARNDGAGTGASQDDGARSRGPNPSGGRSDSSHGSGARGGKPTGEDAANPESRGSNGPGDSLSAFLPPLSGHSVTPEGITLRSGEFPPGSGPQSSPMQLVVQIQLPPGATAEQIDQLVASIARHLAPLLNPPREGRR